MRPTGTKRCYPLLLFCVSAYLFSTAQAQENSVPQSSTIGFLQTEPPGVILGLPSKEAAVPPSASPEAEKIEQVRAIMEKPQEPKQPAPVSAASQEFSLLRNAVRVFSALLMVLAIILLLTYILKRGGKQSALLAGSALATVLGRVHLEPRVRLHFVRTGGKVIVVGVAQNSIAALAEFEADSFTPESGKDREKTPTDVAGFTEQLKASMKSIQRNPMEKKEEDSDVSALKRDIDRLQKYLDESSRFPKKG